MSDSGLIEKTSDVPDSRMERGKRVSRPSKMAKGELFKYLQREFTQDSSHSSIWRREAKDHFDFIAGRQWTPEERSQLHAQLRPEIVFNRAITIVKAVAGFEINSRHEIQFLPRNTTETAINEVLTSASKWMSQNCDGEDEESEAFQHTLVCGMGWCLSDDAMVRLPKNTLFATTRLYSGNVIEIDLENGQKLTGTPNHPVLTDIGWKRLGALQEGDNLVRSSLLERVNGFPVQDFDHVETRMKDRVDAFRRASKAGTGATFATAPNDFYGDGWGSKVHVVYANSLLLDKFRQAARFQEAKERTFVLRDLIAVLRSALFGQSMALHPVSAAVGCSPFNIAHSPRCEIAPFKRAAQRISSKAQLIADSFRVKAEALANFLGGHLLFKVKSSNFGKRNFGLHAPVSATEHMATRPQSISNYGSGHANNRLDFFDWKPLLEIEARKLSRGDIGPFSQFITRVKKRVIRQVKNFAVHDVGTSVGMFVAGDIITSNCEHRIDWEIESRGQYDESVIDPLEMYWDRKARKKNLVDSRRMWRLRRIALSDALDLCPGYDELQLDARWAVGLDPEEETKTLEQKRRREENASGDNFTEQMEVHILHAQWWEREPYWLVGDPLTNQKQELTEEEYSELQKRMKLYDKMGVPRPQFSAVKMMRRVYKQCFVGNEVLGEVTDVIAPTLADERAFQGFSWTCITGEPDHNKGTWFGLIHIMKDPAKWSNKWLSQTMHILNSQAKGGIIVEEDFAADIRKFELGYAKPESIAVVKKGALSNQNGPKFVKKPTADFPQGFYQLLEFAISSLRDVTGINLELLGQQDQNQPGILEAQRKQAGMTVLATMFDSLRRARKLIGRIRLFIIQNYISDGRIVRVMGPDGAQAVPLVRDTCIGEYDVVLDDAPTSPNQKEATWGLIVQMLPMFKDQLASSPDLLVEVMRYSPLPSRLVDALAAKINQPPSPEQQQAAQFAVQKVVAQINKDQSTAEMQNAKAGATQATATLDLAMAQHMMSKDNGPEGDPLQNHLKAVHTAAQIHTENAKRQQIEADTEKTRASIPVDHAASHAKSLKDRVGAMMDALTPIPHQPPMAAQQEQ